MRLVEGKRPQLGRSGNSLEIKPEIEWEHESVQSEDTTASALAPEHMRAHTI